MLRCLRQHNVIDIVAVMPLRPFSIGFEFDPSANDPMQVVLLLVVPIVRLCKMLRRFDKFRLITMAFIIAFEALPVLLFVM